MRCVSYDWRTKPLKKETCSTLFSNYGLVEINTNDLTRAQTECSLLCFGSGFGVGHLAIKIQRGSRNLLWSIFTVKRQSHHSTLALPYAFDCESGAYKSLLNFITLLWGLNKEFLDNKFLRVPFSSDF